MQNLTDIIILIVLVALSAFFSSAETAFTMVRKTSIRAKADDGNKRAKTALYILDNQSKMLTAILVGNNIVNLSASSLSTTFAMRVAGSQGVGIATGILTFVIILFGEITPKSAASVNAESMALADAPVVKGMMTVLTPVIYILEKISRGLERLIGIDPDARTQMTEMELRATVNVSEEEGVIENDEKKMINNVVDLQDTLAREIMIPRIDMTSVPVDSTYDGLIQTFRDHRFTRLPVYKDTPDNVVGIVNIKDLLLVDPKTFVLEDIMKEPYYTYEAKNISDLLDEMRLHSLSIVIVLDEYGSTSGMITMEDVLEEIVGDIHDEYKGRDPEEITPIVPGREYSCLGSVDLDDLGKAIGLHLESEDYDTIGGYIIEHSEDNLPKVGEYIITEEGARLIVEAVRKNRILRVHIYMPEPASEEKTDG